jgi:hypothetical protein
MPLRNPPPSTPLTASGLTTRQATQQRRRTLQTISELHVSSHEILPELLHASTSNNANGYHDDRRVRENTAAKKKKKNRPWTGSFERQPAGKVNVPPLPNLPKASVSNDNPVTSKKGNVAIKPIATLRRQTSLQMHDYNHGTPPVRRHSEREMRDRAIADARARRSNVHGLALGSPSTLPSMSRLNGFDHRRLTPSIQDRGNQQHHVQNGRNIYNGAARHSDRSADALQKGGKMARSASTSGSTHLAHPKEIARSRSTSSMSTPRGISYRPPVAPNPMTPTHSANSFAMARNNYPTPSPAAMTRGRDSRSPNPMARSSSAHSTATVATSASNKSEHSHRRSSPSSHSNRSSRSRKHGITQEHLDALAVLTAPAPVPDGRMTPQSLALFEAQQKQLEEKLRRASIASDRATRASQAHKLTRSTSASGISQHSDMSSRYKASLNGHLTTNNGSGQESSNALTPESVRLLREREKLLRWKAEREKAEFQRREREKIKERVRRANEMEEARDRELVEQKQKKRQRGCCGLFGA